LTFSKVEHSTRTNYELTQGDEDKTQLWASKKPSKLMKK
jgi:hypothetical protein